MRQIALAIALSMNIMNAAADEITVQQRNIMLLLTGLDKPPYADAEAFRNSRNVLIKSVKVEHTAEFVDPCVVVLTSAYQQKEKNLVDKYEDLASTIIQRFDFRKMTAMGTSWQPDPVENMYFVMAGGQALRRPRMVTVVEYRGKDASCTLDKNGKVLACTKDTSSATTTFQHPSGRPDKVQAAFKAVKQQCPTG